MKIAAGRNFQAAADFCLQLVTKFVDVRKIEKIFAIGVWRGDDVRNSIGNRRLRHRDRFFHGGGAIIETGQNVTMQIDHSNEPSLVPPGTESLDRTKPEQN